MNEQQQKPNDGLPPVSIDDLLRMIGDAQVTIRRQALLIAQQSARLAELNKGNGQASDVTTTAWTPEVKAAYQAQQDTINSGP